MATVDTENRENLLEANAEYAASRPKKLRKLRRLPQKKFLIGSLLSRIIGRRRLDNFHGELDDS